MMRSVLLVALSAVALIPAFGQTRVAVENVTLIDGTDHAPRRNVTVIVQGENIIAITRKRITQPRGTKIIDGTGKFLIPGLWNNDLMDQPTMMQRHPFCLWFPTELPPSGIWVRL